jgi:Zn-dependent metalloprotease
MPIMAAIPSPAGDKYRLVYDMRNSRQIFFLPGHLARSEGQAPVQDEAVDEAYEFSGLTYDFYQQVFGRNSIDGQGMQLISSVHFSRRYNNAFWNGEQMVYGDGDGVRFVRFTKALDVVGHELTHGVVQHTSNLEYQDESGALNEHFADVMGEVIQQWHQGFTVEQADWYMGGDIMAPSLGIKGLRTFKAEKAYENHPIFGADPQPKHMEDKYTGDEDNGGVHINSGIPNHCFYLAAMELGGKSWEKVGHIWYQTLLRLQRFSTFQDTAEVSCDVAARLFGPLEANIIKMAWDKVGITIR